MSALVWMRRRAGALGAVLLVALSAASSLRAEVGASASPGAYPYANPYILAAIGDDPDPFSAVWHVFNPTGGGRAILNPAGEANGDGAPSVLVDPQSGLVLVAWARNSANGFDIVTSRLSDGEWTAPQIVAGDPTLGEKDPNLVLGPDGTVHLFYWVDGATPQVLETHAPSSDLSSWATPVLVSDPTKPSCRPAGAVYNGIVRVAYEVHDFGYGNSPRQVVLAKQEGSGFTPEIVALTNNLGNVWPQVHGQGSAMWIDWIDAESGGSGEIAWTRIDTQGHWEPLRYEPFANHEQRDYLTRGAIKLKALQ